MEYSQVFDVVRFQKAKAAAGFYLLRRIPKFRRILVVLVLGLISWSTSLAPAAALVRFSAYLLNHHVAFLIGNSIVALLFVLFRSNDEKRIEPVPLPLKETTGGGDEEETVVGSPPCDEAAVAIEKAARQIRRFERTQSEKLRREIGVKPRRELQRSESEKWPRSVSSCDKVDMERLTGDEFQRTVEDFISKHWNKKTTKEELC